MSLEQFVTDWGLPALALGSVAEGDAVAFLGGVLAHRGHFRFEAAALAVAGGGFVADQICFHLGRHARRIAWVQRMIDRPATQSVLAKAHVRPNLYALSMRFLYGLRTVGAAGLGAAGLSPLRYAVLDALSCLAWAHVVVGLGFGAGQAIERAIGHTELLEHLLAALAITLVAGVALWAIGRVLWRR